MPIYQEMKCSECYKYTLHVYIPRIPLNNSYWKCIQCDNPLSKVKINDLEFEDCHFEKSKKKKGWDI